MRQLFEKKLQQYNRRTISLKDLERLPSKYVPYETFASVIQSLETDGVLTMVKARGRNHHEPSLAYHYRINKHELNKSYHRELQAYRLTFHQAIDLDEYFHLPEVMWRHDMPFLEKINTYIETFGFPEEKVPAPERSFALVGDEKWIDEQGGADVLQRVRLWEKMNMFPVSDPLMLAIHPGRVHEREHMHLIVENKTTYQALLPVLTETEFSTLIYGSGNKISKSIENFATQYPVAGDHTFFYFGDIDRSGLTIWHSLHEREPALPAVPFYLACLEKEAAYGKTNQRPNERAEQAFLRYFTADTKKTIGSLFERGAYYPQEVLKTDELQGIWLDTDWVQLTRSLLEEKGE